MANTMSINGNQGIVNPTPLISISTTPNKNKLGYFGASYQLTISGTIVYNSVSPNQSTKVLGINSSIGSDGLAHILQKQADITGLFTEPKGDPDGLTVEVMNSTGDRDVMIFKRCRVESITFEEGIYVNLCRYTVVLTSDEMFDANGNLHASSQLNIFNLSGETYPSEGSQSYFMLEDLQESWDISSDDSLGASGPNGALVRPRSYTVSRTVTAVSKIPANTTSTSDPAWKRASDFLYSYISENVADAEQNLSNVLGNSLLNFTNFSAYNNSRTFQVDKAAGSATCTDTWIVARSNEIALENFEISVTSDSQSPHVRVSINGTIKGLSTWHDEIEYNQASNTVTDGSPILQAQSKWNSLSSNGNFGVGSMIYRRANSACNVTLNDQPLSISVSSNEVNGEISYSVEFDNRPRNIFTNALTESITVTDTYPGDQFAVIPVIGRATGPILQFTFGRTEYKRSLSIEVQFDYTSIDYNNPINLINSKPSMASPARGQLSSLISSLSPANDVGIRKYFLSPPQESWSKDGRYSLNLEWTYELNT